MNSTFLILIDETCPESLALVQALQQAGCLDRKAEGEYEVTGYQADIMRLLDEYPLPVMKAEII